MLGPQNNTQALPPKELSTSTNQQSPQQNGLVLPPPPQSGPPQVQFDEIVANLGSPNYRIRTSSLSKLQQLVARFGENLRPMLLEAQRTHAEHCQQHPHQPGNEDTRVALGAVWRELNNSTRTQLESSDPNRFNQGINGLLSAHTNDRAGSAQIVGVMRSTSPIALVHTLDRLLQGTAEEHTVGLELLHGIGDSGAQAQFLRQVADHPGGLAPEQSAQIQRVANVIVEQALTTLRQDPPQNGRRLGDIPAMEALIRLQSLATPAVVQAFETERGRIAGLAAGTVGTSLSGLGAISFGAGVANENQGRFIGALSHILSRLQMNNTLDR